MTPNTTPAVERRDVDALRYLLNWADTNTRVKTIMRTFTDDRETTQERLERLYAALAPAAPERVEGSDWPSDGTCVQCGGAPRSPETGLCATCHDETPAIPAGMVPWHGGDAAPEDWDGGQVQFRVGKLSQQSHNWAWFWGDPHDDYDIIAYTPVARPAATAGEVERCPMCEVWKATAASEAEAFEDAQSRNRELVATLQSDRGEVEKYKRALSQIAAYPNYNRITSDEAGDRQTMINIARATLGETAK